MKSKLTLEQRTWIQKNGYSSPEDLPAEFLGDKNFAVEFCGNNGSALQCFAFSLRSDEDVVLSAVKDCGSALRFADYPIRKSRSIVLAAVKLQRSFILQLKTMAMRCDTPVSVFVVIEISRPLR
jgi:hypothetical protein